MKMNPIFCQCDSAISGCDYSNKQIINKIVDAINDMGFDCKLIEVLPVQRSVNTKVTALIGGMTCAVQIRLTVLSKNYLLFWKVELMW